MSRTTLSVPGELRDRLAAIAASRNTTMLALLEEAARRLEREEATHQVTASYERLAREDPESFADYLAEGRRWDALAADGLGNAREEFPELNSWSVAATSWSRTSRLSSGLSSVAGGRC